MRGRLLAISSVPAKTGCGRLEPVTPRHRVNVIGQYDQPKPIGVLLPLCRSVLRVLFRTGGFTSA